MEKTHEATISIIAPNYNDSKYFDRWFVAALSQTKQPHEIIICDDASTDDSLKLLEQYRNKHPSLIKIVSLKKNTGGFQAFNEGVKIATGDFVACWSMDDEMLDEYIEKMSTYINLFKKEDLFLCRAVVEREDSWFYPKNTTGGAVVFSAEGFCRGLQEHSIGCFIGHILRRTTMLDYIENGGGEIKACFDAMYIYFTGLSKGAVLVNDFLVIYHARFGGLGTRKGWREHLYYTNKILELCQTKYPRVYPLLIESRAFHWSRAIPQRLALWLVPKMSPRWRKRVYEFIYK